MIPNSAALIFGVAVIGLLVFLAISVEANGRRLDRIAALLMPVKVEAEPEKVKPQISPEAVAALIRASTPTPGQPVDHFATPSADECDHRRAKAQIRKQEIPAGERITCPTCAAELIVGERNAEGKPTVVTPNKSTEEPRK